MVNRTTQRSIRLTADDLALLAALAARLGLDHTAIIRLALRALADKEGVR